MICFEYGNYPDEHETSNTTCNYKLFFLVDALYPPKLLNIHSMYPSPYLRKHMNMAQTN